MKDDTISRAAAIDALKRTEALSRAFGYHAVIDAIEALPSARQGIVACGDCKHWICHDRRCGYWNHGVKPLDWCCHAERRTDG